MSVSKKIIDEIEKIDDKDEKFKNLMLEILEEESKGIPGGRFKAKYEEMINKYIEENIVEVVVND